MKRFFHAPPYRGSFLHSAPLPSLQDWPQLRHPYCVIQPVTTRDKSRPRRALTYCDWFAVLSWLERERLLGVVVNDETTEAPPGLLNLSGKLSILQTLAVMRSAAGYLGIDSFLSVLAAQLPLRVFQIKTNRQHCHDWAHLYFAPHRAFPFLVSEIAPPER